MDCTKCHQEKPLVKGKRICKECKNSYERQRRARQSEEKKEDARRKERERYARNKSKVEDVGLEQAVEINPEEEKTCTVCGETKKITQFHLAKTKGKVRAMCKKCSSQQRKEYYRNNKTAVNKQVTQYQVEKMKRDPLYKLERRLRCRIYHALIAQGQTKTQRTHKYLGCTSQFFQEWIEYQLYDGMTMDNYGKFWHVDHVTPCASFDLSDPEQLDKCFNWKNLRPYKAEKNLIKNDKIDPKEVTLQELKVKCFLRDRQKDGNHCKDEPLIERGQKSHRSLASGSAKDEKRSTARDAPTTKRRKKQSVASGSRSTVKGG